MLQSITAKSNSPLGHCEEKQMTLARVCANLATFNYPTMDVLLREQKLERDIEEVIAYLEVPVEKRAGNEKAAGSICQRFAIFTFDRGHAAF